MTKDNDLYDELWTALRLLRKNSAISKQQYRTYKGQILAGDIEGCIKGLKRKGLIIWAEQ